MIRVIALFHVVNTPPKHSDNIIPGNIIIHFDSYFKHDWVLQLVVEQCYYCTSNVPLYHAGKYFLDDRSWKQQLNLGSSLYFTRLD